MTKTPPKKTNIYKQLVCIETINAHEINYQYETRYILNSLTKTKSVINNNNILV